MQPRGSAMRAWSNPALESRRSWHTKTVGNFLAHEPTRLACCYLRITGNSQRIRVWACLKDTRGTQVFHSGEICCCGSGYLTAKSDMTISVADFQAAAFRLSEAA
ncbi:hypothetical protein AO716_01460 [Arthrobacter sp. Edens01]|nr:hypothetical protein AO716_01460 [Arthrobacter sp. Edens01]